MLSDIEGIIECIKRDGEKDMVLDCADHLIVSLSVTNGAMTKHSIK